jgi:hypothetical protein
MKRIHDEYIGSLGIKYHDEGSSQPRSATERESTTKSGGYGDSDPPTISIHP